jgi:uncharacterized SAM-binding protein YcdF (DUF218 family)
MSYTDPVMTLLLVAILAAAWRWPARRSRFAAAAAVGLLFLWAWPPMAWLVAATLEPRGDAGRVPTGEADAIVVLSSSAIQASASMPEDLPGQSTYLRCRYAAWLYHHWRPLPVVVSGGRAPAAVAADAMRHVLESEGVPADRIVSERRSSSTYENAVFTAGLLLPQGMRRIALVTEAYHMPRAERCFRKQGFTVLPAPCGFRVLEPANDPGFWLPGWRGLRDNDLMLHEWVGLAWYALRRRI